MINLGSLLILFTAACTAYAMAAYLPGVRKGAGRPRLRQARLAVYLAGLGLVLSSAHLWQLIFTHQYQYDYVYRYSSRELPIKYMISAFWGGQEGTFLLWALFGGMLSVFLRFKARHYEAPVQFFYMGINLFLLLIMIKRSPFTLLPQTPPDGMGLNPLLQDPWMTIHPPVVFFGFAALGIPAAYAMAAMIKEDWDSWVRASLPWTSFGVLSLGLGLILGGYWAYSILGWGGFWGWDPVENSSLVPWIMGGVLLHNQLIQLKKGLYRRFNLILALVPFLLLTYSTFLTRSGILADFSVHSFTDLGINQFLVMFMVAFGGGGLALYLWKQGRIPRTKDPNNFWSREVMTFLGAMSLALFGLAVLLGTSAPLITRITGTPSNVQPEFYNRLAMPFALIFALLMALAPQFMWNHMERKDLLRRLRWPLVGAVLFIPVGILAGMRNPGHLTLATLSLFALFSNLRVLLQIIRFNPRLMGGPVTHSGIALCILGIMISTAYTKKEVLMLPQGKAVAALGYQFLYTGHRPVEDGAKNAYDVMVQSDDASYRLSPTMFYSEMNQGMMKKPAIQSFLTHDVYVAPVRTASESLEERLQTKINLDRGVPTDTHGILFLVQDLKPKTVADDGHGHAAQEVTAHLQVTVEGETHQVETTLRKHPNGHAESLHIELPGTDVIASLLRAEVATGRVVLGLLPKPLSIKKGNVATLSGYQLLHNGFEVDMTATSKVRATVWANVQVKTASETWTVKPGLQILTDGQNRALIEAPIGETGMNLAMVSFDSNTGEGIFNLAPSGGESLYVEASIKPFIMLLWLGTIIGTLGLAISTFYRGGEAVRKVTKRQGGDKPPQKRPRQRAAAA